MVLYACHIHLTHCVAACIALVFLFWRHRKPFNLDFKVVLTKNASLVITFLDFKNHQDYVGVVASDLNEGAGNTNNPSTVMRFRLNCCRNLIIKKKSFGHHKVCSNIPVSS